MSATNKILDDIAKVAGGTISVFSGLHGEIRQEIKAHIDDLVCKMDLVPRDEFEKTQSMLSQARQEQERLIKRIEYLEDQINANKSKG